MNQYDEIEKYIIAAQENDIGYLNGDEPEEEDDLEQEIKRIIQKETTTNARKKTATKKATADTKKKTTTKKTTANTGKKTATKKATTDTKKKTTRKSTANKKTEDK